MKKVTHTLLLVLCTSLWINAQTYEFGVRSLPLLVDNDVNNIWTGDLDQYGYLVFSVTEQDNPIGMWEYVAEGSVDDDELNLLIDEPGIVDLVAYQSQYGDMNRYVYYLQWELGTSYTYLKRYSDTHPIRPFIRFEQLMYGLEVSDVLNYGDVVVWGNKSTGELYDLYGELTGLTRNGIIHGLFNDSSVEFHERYRAWTKDVGIIPGAQFCAIYINDEDINSSKLIGGFGPANSDGYATRLLCTDGTSAVLDELPQPEEAEYTWMGTVPYQGPEGGTMRFMAAGWVNGPNGYEYQLLIWNEDLSDWSVYQNFGEDFPGQFKLHAHIVDEDNNDALVLGGENIDLALFGFPQDYSGLIVLNSEEWKPLEDILGYSFLNTEDGDLLPDFRVLEYNKETGQLWAAGKEIEGKDDDGLDIQAGFIIQIDGIDGMLFPQTTNVEEVAALVGQYEFEVYPNPTSDRIFIQANKALGPIRVFDISGKPVHLIDPSYNTEVMEVDLSDLPNGMYLIQVHMEDGVISQSVIKATPRP
jgi:hypothetical protein